MATTLTINNFKASLGFSYINSTTYGTNAEANGVFSYSESLTNGTGAAKAQKLYASQITIAGGATTSIDLSGSLTDQFGNALVFTKVKIIYIQLDDSVTPQASSISVGGNAAAVAACFGNANDKVVILAGGIFLLGNNSANGYAVTATTADILDITNLDGSVIATVNVGIVGE